MHGGIKKFEKLPLSQALKLTKKQVRLKMKKRRERKEWRGVQRDISAGATVKKLGERGRKFFWSERLRVSLLVKKFEND